jgi:chitin synthase
VDFADLRQWAIYKDKVYDLSDYLFTVDYYVSSSGTDLPNYKFLDSSLSGLFSTNAGQDITKQMDAVMAGMTDEKAQQTWQCLNTAFYAGQTDFRETAKCLVQNYLLLALSIILCTVILVKCEW